MRKNIILTIIFLFIFFKNVSALLLPTETPKGLTKSEKIAVNKLQTESVLESAYLKAEQRLSSVEIGMSIKDFLWTMGIFEISTPRGKLIDIAVDGLISIGDFKGKQGENIIKYLFGYVKNRIIIPKFVVEFVDSKLTNIDRFKKYYLEDEKYIGQMNRKERKELEKTKKEINEKRYNEEAFLKAKERIKNVNIGMDIIEFVRTMEGNYVLLWVGEDFFILMDGFLNFKGDYEECDIETEEGKKLVWPFGYMENGKEIPKFFVVTLNDKVVDIIFNTDKGNFEKSLKCDGE